MEDTAEVMAVDKERTNVMELFSRARTNKTYLKICAPMVRYSKVEYRTLVRRYGVDLCFTPMIMADSFCQSYKARHSEFATATKDTPVIAQFAAKTVADYLSATEMVMPYVDGVDLNCGCPQRWAMSTGYGSAMLNDPELMRDLTATIRRNAPPSFSVSVKLRVQRPLSQTIELCRQLEHCGVSFLTVHGRTPFQKIKEPSNEDALIEIRKSLQIPLVANGDVKTLSGADALADRIGCDGVMSARGILANPGLFAGFDTTPLRCVQDWVDICESVGEEAITFQCFHHHLTFMMEKLMKRKTRVIFNSFSKREEVMEFLEQEYGIRPSCRNDSQWAGHDVGRHMRGEFDETNYKQRVRIENEKRAAEERQQRCIYDAEASEGKFFRSKVDGDNIDGGAGGNDDDDENFFMESNLFDS